MIYFKEAIGAYNLKDLLKRGFSCRRGEGEWYSFVKTYSNPQLTREECHEARRSFDDLLEISRTYFPDTTEEELAKTLYELHGEINLYFFFCSDIHKQVFCTCPKEAMSYGKFSCSEWPNSSFENSGRSKYSAKRIMELAGLDPMTQKPIVATEAAST